MKHSVRKHLFDRAVTMKMKWNETRPFLFGFVSFRGFISGADSYPVAPEVIWLVRVKLWEGRTKRGQRLAEKVLFLGKIIVFWTGLFFSKKKGFFRTSFCTCMFLECLGSVIAMEDDLFRLRKLSFEHTRTQSHFPQSFVVLKRKKGGLGTILLRAIKVYYGRIEKSECEFVTVFPHCTTTKFNFFSLQVMKSRFQTWQGKNCWAVPPVVLATMEIKFMLPTPGRS